jgi:tetratricopeptide (TPR) repeat protein
MHATVQKRLELLKSDMPAARGPGCPEESEWPWIAAGLRAWSEAESSVRHAAGCDHCGPILRRVMADFADEITVDEEEMLARLESNQQTWQRQLASKLCDTSHSRSWLTWLRRRLLPAPVPKWAYAGAVAGLGAVLFWGVYSLQSPPIDKLLARAYTEQRTIELRFPNAAYAPVRLIRGGADRSRLDRPPALLESEARIARELAKNPSNPALLQARGRAELLEWNYADAIATLEQVLTLEPDSPSLQTDLASAYYERAEAEHNPADYLRAVDLLAKVLQSRPGDPVALFNRGIVYERMRLNPQAAADWREYLRVDPDSAWTAEVKRRLAGIGQANGNR